LLILGHKRWWQLFEDIRTGDNKGDTESRRKSEEELDACLLWAHAEAQTFAAAQSTTAHLYH
jgi:hypothetical protein